MTGQTISRSTQWKLFAMALVLAYGLIFNSTQGLAQRRRTARRTATAAVPHGTQMKIRLETTIDSNQARTGDRFKATVMSPNRFADSTLERHISRVRQSGKFKGKTAVILVFDRIRFEEGGSAPLHADVSRIYGENSAKVDDEGGIKSGSRGESTAKRTAGGAVAGAIIGGIAGGGKGAAIGATIGAGVGAGSNYIRGSSRVKIEEGTEMLIRVSR